MWFGNIRTKDSINVNKDVRIVTKYEPTPRCHCLLQKVPPVVESQTQPCTENLNCFLHAVSTEQHELGVLGPKSPLFM